jgi:hypothetical protein
VSTDGTAKVAGRSAYELVLAPRDARSRVGSVRLAVDASERIPLRVRVFARGSDARGGGEPAYEIGFTRISFTKPSDGQFRFTPPPGAKVEPSVASEKPGAIAHTPSGASAKPGASAKQGASAQPRVVGEGWAAVLVADATGGEVPGELSGVFEQLPRVSGRWGSGRLLESRLLSVLLTDDGRLLAGAVDPQRLYQVAAQR